MKKKILVTGGAGYIGSHTVVELIEAGYVPVIVDDLSKSDETLLKGIEELKQVKLVFHQGDCCNVAFMDSVFAAEKTIESVIHFAAYKSVGESVGEPMKYYRNNINSLLTLLEIMQKRGVRNIIFSSSCTVYGQPDQIPVRETAPFKKAESPYGATKQMCEEILQDAAKRFVCAVSLRYFNPIGAHPSALLGELPIGIPANLVPYITQTAIGKRPQLTIFGADYDTPDGTCQRDFIHVVDLAKAHVKALDFLEKKKEETGFEALNVGTGKALSVLELIRTFEQVMGLKLNYAIGPRRSGDVVKVYADPTLSQKALQWQAAHTVADALLHAWQWEKKLAQKK